MSTTDEVITRRTVFVAVAGAACTLLVPPGRADDELPQQRGPYRIEDWGKAWLNPNKARVLARVPAVAMPDIAGYWPQTTRPVRGPQEYGFAHAWHQSQLATFVNEVIIQTLNSF
jgi:hypothetical protein